MRQFLVNIWAYDHHAKFKVSADDSAESIEKAVLDKIGEKSITWEDLGNSYRDQRRITYGELIDGTRPVQYEKILGVEVAVGV